MVKTWISNLLVTQRARPAGVTFTNHTRFLQGPADPVLADVTGFAARKDSQGLLGQILEILQLVVDPDVVNAAMKTIWCLVCTLAQG